jgi:hypothetical protein
MLVKGLKLGLIFGGISGLVHLIAAFEPAYIGGLVFVFLDMPMGALVSPPLELLGMPLKESTPQFIIALVISIGYFLLGMIIGLFAWVKSGKKRGLPPF